MDIYKFLLINLVYFAGINSAWSHGIGYYSFFRPVVAGMLTGFVLGDVVLGMTAGAVVNIVYLDFISFEDKLNADPCLTAIITVTAAVVLKINSIEALAVAFLLGFTVNLVWKYHLSINEFLTIKFNNFKSKFLFELILPQIVLFLMSTFIISICFFFIYLSKGFFDTHYEFMTNLLFLSGIFIILNSIFSIVLSKDYSSLVYIYIFTFIMLFFVRSIAFVFALVLFIFYFLFDSYKSLYKNKFISKTSIVSNPVVWKMWFLWFNFSYFSQELENERDINSFNIIKDNIFVQVILSKIFALLCIYFALFENLALLITFLVIFIAIIIYVSYSNFKVGYYNGREALIQRIVMINKSKLKKYFNYIFSILFMIAIVNLKLKYNAVFENNVSSILSIIIASILLKILSHRKIKEYYLIPIIYLIPLVIVLVVPSI